MSAALGEMLEEAFNVVVVNSHPQIVSSFYSYASRHAVASWSKVMKATDTETGARRMHAILYALTRNRLARIITEADPDLIISTHSMLSYEVTEVLTALRRSIPVVFQVTDLTLHHMWVTEKRASAYLASTCEIFNGLLDAGIEKARVVLTGRPVRRQFLEDYSASSAATRLRLGLDPSLFTAYIQGGAEGSAQIIKTIYNVLEACPDIQCIVATGHNSAMLRRVSGLSRVAALPYTAHIAPYMAASDVIVGKPGAGSVGEAIRLEKPFIASTVIPYQETPNVDFIERHNLGWGCLEPGALADLMRRLVADRSLMAEKTQALQVYAAFNRDASHQLVPLMRELLARPGSEASRDRQALASTPDDVTSYRTVMLSRDASGVKD